MSTDLTPEQQSTRELESLRDAIAAERATEAEAKLAEETENRLGEHKLRPEWIEKHDGLLVKLGESVAELSASEQRCAELRKVLGLSIKFMRTTYSTEFLRAVNDPGKYTPRGDNYKEALGDWQNRAVKIATDAALSDLAALSQLPKEAKP